jgi:RHS repeat-associated protein
VTGGTTITTDYAGNYIYETDVQRGSRTPLSQIYKREQNGNLQFFNTPEGYAEPINVGNYTLGFRHTFQYKDHLNNIRLSYNDLNQNTGAISLSIVEENNYYPFGLKQKGYNGTVNGADYPYGFQDQEETNDPFGFNMIEFKYRMHDPAIGRFIQVDPLAAEYVYNGTYNFSENRVIDGIELEGLEWESIKNEETGNTKLQLTIQLYNESSLSEEKLNERMEEMKTQFSESYSGEGYTGELVVNSVTEAKGDFLVKVIDGVSTTSTKEDGTTVTSKVNGSAPNSLDNLKTQASEDKSTVRINIAGTMDGSTMPKSGMARTFSHEAGHTAGLRHTWDPKNTILDVNQNTPTVTNQTLRSNLMNSGSLKSKVPSTTGRTLTSSQLKSVDEIIRQQQSN